MRVLSLVTLGFAATALAAPAIEIENGAGEIKEALASVKGAVSNLSGAVSKVESPDDKAAIETVSQKSEDLNSVISAAKDKVEKASPVGLIDAISISAPATDLAGAVGELAVNLGSKKPVLDKAGQAKSIVSKVAQSREHSKGLSKAILAKLPSVAKPVAEKATEKIDTSLEKVVATYNSS